MDELRVSKGIARWTANFNGSLPSAPYTSDSYTKLLMHMGSDATGKVTISLTAAQTAAVKAGRYVYDVEITGTSPVETLRVLEGLITVTPEVTKV